MIYQEEWRKIHVTHFRKGRPMTIIEKLKLDRYTDMAVINEPDDYDLFTEQTTALSQGHDAIFIFVETLEEMVKYTKRVIDDQLLLEAGYLFFAYPKKGNKRYSGFIHRDELFPAMKVGEDGFVADSDLKFSRMVSMDDVFTVVGIKRESKKKGKKSTAASQRVSDYEDRVKEVEEILESSDAVEFFRSLTPGYQKDWARYIFSAKQETTRNKRQQQMKELLAEGYKSIALYRLKKK